MKKILTKVLITLASVVTFAQMQDPAVTSLGSSMKAMSSDLKKIVAQVNDATKNVSSETLALDFVKHTEASKNFKPDTISSLPASEQPAKMEDYKKMLDETAKLGKELADAFHNNDNKLATEILNKLSQAKKDGHAEYK